MVSDHTPCSAPFLGDNLALDFINSEYLVDNQLHDCFTDDQSILDWLTSAGLLPAVSDRLPPDGLLTAARNLRHSAREIVRNAMSRSASDLTLINQILDAGQPVRRVAWDAETQQFRVAVCQQTGSPSGLLWPVADALVSLVTSDKFKFVRQCEADDCILLFHDLSKSHRRRWCSMATCGNRMKVAAFRSRKRAE